MEIKKHYDAKEQKPKQAFYKSHITVLKKLNNWIKSILIQKYTQENHEILDLACGKGGDLPKWFHTKAKRVVCTDISQKQLDRAASRVLPKDGPEISFVQGDFTSLEEFNPHTFHLISCQFAFHYAFESEIKLQNTLQTLSTIIRPGGIFMLTIPDGTKLQDMLFLTQKTKSWKVRYTVPDFGARYHFYLKDAIDCEEFIVKQEVLLKYCTQFGFTLVETQSFSEAFFQYRENPKAQEIATSMQLSLRSRDVPQDLWEIFSLYRLYVFWRAPF